MVCSSPATDVLAADKGRSVTASSAAGSVDDVGFVTAVSACLEVLDVGLSAVEVASMVSVVVLSCRLLVDDDGLDPVVTLLVSLVSFSSAGWTADAGLDLAEPDLVISGVDVEGSSGFSADGGREPELADCLRAADSGRRSFGAAVDATSAGL